MDFDIDVDIYNGYRYLIMGKPTITHKHIEFRNAIIQETLEDTIYIDDTHVLIMPRDYRTRCRYIDKKIHAMFYCDIPAITPIIKK